MFLPLVIILLCSWTFAMSKCPDFARFNKNVYSPLVSSIGEIISVTPYFIASYDPSQKYKFKSMHGDTEVLGDLYELCVFDMKTVDEYTSFLMCLNENQRDIPQNVETCCQNLGFDYSQLENCALGEQGFNLMWNAVNKTEEVGVRWCPTVYLDEKEFCEYDYHECDVEQDNLEQWIKKICDMSTKHIKPDACN